ncbi:hypothetical protein HYH02_001151 [Chlamydomonas schloesseri]|uniref:Probable sodium/metabolite cotransporter BASS4, chloroplastic n=1 Tax=Chlamydomonas schloesseri TaxID=2026947 RepID=A0A835WVD5_9CHLO|nr:hypothetical protein HYH02_001151 [Chlamydomonas schloesseri]|eukprot:KAG2454112.1 hypothetical protein HYH02_001151 [Chlamydomonas schloesseri]
MLVWQGATPAGPKSSWDKAKAAVVKNFLPLAFATALVWALVWPDPGAYLVGLKVAGNVRIAQVLPVVLVFLISGLQLDTRDMRAALSARNLPTLAYGLAAILLVTPLLGLALRELPLEPKEFATGLTVFSVAPTTLGVGVALTAACGGNEALALLLTVATNALAVFTMPPELQLLLPPAAEGAAGAGALNVNVWDLLTKLAATVLVPFVLGKAAREYLPGAAAFAKAHRTRLSLFSTSCLAFVVWQTLSSARDLLLAQQPGPLAAMVVAALGMHLFYLAANFAVVWHLLRPPLREAIAVGIMASQKSAPVAVTVISYLSSNPAQQGLMALPAVVGQMGQIFIGAALARQLSALVARQKEAEALAAKQQQQQQQAGGSPAVPHASSVEAAPWAKKPGDT